jgi:hypothetical protein
MQWLPGNFVHDLLLWVWSVVDSWAGYTTGGVLVALITVRAWLYKELSKVQALAALTFFVLFALFSSWRTEYLKTAPGLKLEINSVAVGSVGQTGVTGVTVFARISNLGNPTIADEWSLNFYPVGTPVKKYGPLVIHRDAPVTFRGFNGNTIEEHFTAKDTLYSKTIPTPLVNGAREEGFMSFLLPDVSKGDAEKVGARYELVCRDVAGNTIRGSWVWDGSRLPGAPYVPGMDDPNEVKPQ